MTRGIMRLAQPRAAPVVRGAGPLHHEGTKAGISDEMESTLSQNGKRKSRNADVCLDVCDSTKDRTNRCIMSRRFPQTTSPRPSVLLSIHDGRLDSRNNVCVRDHRRLGVWISAPNGGEVMG